MGSDVWSLMLGAIVLSPLFLCLCFLRQLRWFPVRKLRYPPVAGTIFHQLFHFRRIYDYHTDLSCRHKTFRLLTPTYSRVYTTDPRNVEHILKTNFDNYGKGPLIQENIGELLGEGIFVVDGDKWRQQRKIASHEFSTKVLRDFSSNIFRRNATKLAHAICGCVDSNLEFDIQDMFMKSTLDSIFKVGFGVDLNALMGSSNEFSKAFDKCTMLSLRHFFDPVWKLKRFLDFGSEAELRRSVKVVDDFVYGVIRWKSNQTSSMDVKEDILSRFLDEQRKGSEEMTEKYLKDILVNFMFAGRDTTAGTLSWFLYLICKNPSIQEKIHKEVTEAIRQGSDILSIDQFSCKLTESAIGQMSFLHATLTETLRLYPAVPMDPKHCFKDDILPDGNAVKKGDHVDFQPYVMGRMEYMWGPEALKFKPERWLDQNGIFQPESSFKFTAFQSGLRICLGKEFAYRQMKITAATLLYFFRFEFHDKNQIVNYKVSITLHIDNGLHVCAFHR